MRKRFDSTDEPRATAKKRRGARNDRRTTASFLSSSNRSPRLMGFSVFFLVVWTACVMILNSILWRIQSLSDGESRLSSRSLRTIKEDDDEELDTFKEENSSAEQIQETSQVEYGYDTLYRSEPLEEDANKSLKIVWLMSFPNSGTSFTSRLVREATRTMTATNYADEVVKMDGQQQQQPVFDDQSMGPFWIPQDNFTTPNRFVLTKTHCGLRCSECPPEEYAETTYSFRRKCAATKWLDGNHQAKYGNYPFERIQKAIHLIRNPFDNVVSRFHLLSAGTMNKDIVTQEQQQQQYPATKHGFLEYCLKIDGLFTRNEIKYAHFRNIPALRDLWLVPCHAEFCKYIEWHNLAFHTTSDMEIDTLVVHYDSFPQAGAIVLDFLQLEAKGDIPEFDPKTYNDYFLESERKIVQKAFEFMASKKTWTYVKRYFEDGTL